MENDIMRFDKELESLWHDMQLMNKEELEIYTQRLFIKLYNIKYQQKLAEEEARSLGAQNRFSRPLLTNVILLY